MKSLSVLSVGVCRSEIIILECDILFPLSTKYCSRGGDIKQGSGGAKMGSMYAKIRDESKAEAEGQRRKCPSCGRLMKKLPSGDWYCQRCNLKSEALNKKK